MLIQSLLNEWLSDEKCHSLIPTASITPPFSAFYIHVGTTYWIIFGKKNLENFYISTQKEQLTQHEHMQNSTQKETRIGDWEKISIYF